MSLVTNLSNLATRIATEIKGVRTLVNGNAADLSALTTTTKTSLVAAINEVKDIAGASIDDATTSTSKVWSSSKTNTAISSAVSALVASAPSTLDTLNELAAALGNDANYASTITTALGNKADSSTVSSLSSTVSTLSTNVGDTTTNFVTTFEAGLV